MEHNYTYRLTTIQRLAPSLEQMDFQLTNTVLGEQPIESLAFSVSLDKIQCPSLSKFDNAIQEEFNLQQKLVPVQTDKQITKPKGKVIEPLKKTKLAKKLKETVHINKAIIYFEKNRSKSKVIPLASTSSTIKNLSRQNSPEMSTKPLKQQNSKKSPQKWIDTIKTSKPKSLKYAPYLQKIRPKITSFMVQSSSPKNSNPRKKINSTRK